MTMEPCVFKYVRLGEDFSFATSVNYARIVLNLIMPSF
jgi:hypothetical protein